MNEHVPAKLFIAALYAHRSVTQHSIHKSAEQTVAIRRPTQQKKLKNCEIPFVIWKRPTN